MKILTALIGILLIHPSTAQDYEKMKNSFLSEVVIGDSINLKTLPKEPIVIDSLLLFKHIDYQTHSVMELSIDGSITSFVDTGSISLKMNLIQQIEGNNNFKWKDLNKGTFYLYEKRKKKKGSVNYSLPIFYSENNALIYYSWHFDALYAGKSVDFWEYKDGMWQKIKSETLWMS